MTDDELELRVLERYVERHREAEIRDPHQHDKCAREIDIRDILHELTGAIGIALNHDAQRWLLKLAPAEPGHQIGPLKRCSRPDQEHKFHARAFFGAQPHPTPAWDRINELQKIVTPSTVSSQEPRVVSDRSRIRLFISHATIDRELAGLVVALFRSALKLPASAIRCTSVDGHRLPGGADTDEQLRTELHEAEALVGILSSRSVQSPYVLIELGGRWLIGKHLLPLLSPGTPANVVGGPLAGKNALRADSAAQLHQMVEDVARQLGVTPESSSVYQEQIDEILKVGLIDSLDVSTAGKVNVPPMPRLSADEQALTVSPRDQTPPIAISVELIANVSAGATPGAWIRATNRAAEAARGAAFKLMDVLLWNEAVSRFVQTTEVHQNGPFVEIETGKDELFCAQPKDLGFIRAEQGTLRIEGARDGQPENCRIKTAGLWQLVGRVETPDGRRCEAVLCFEWDGKVSPKPCACPPRLLDTMPPVAPGYTVGKQPF